MNDVLPLRPFLRGFLMSLAAIVGLLVTLSPVAPGGGGIPMPDLVFALACVWALRRPTGAPLLILFALGLMSDLMMGRPVGLGTLTLLVVTEILRGQTRTLRDLPLVVEWLVVALLLITSIIVQYLVLWVTLAPAPRVSDVLAAGAVTMICYPIVVSVARYGLGLRYPRRRFIVTPLGTDAVQ